MFSDRRTPRRRIKGGDGWTSRMQANALIDRSIHFFGKLSNKPASRTGECETNSDRAYDIACDSSLCRQLFERGLD